MGLLSGSASVTRLTVTRRPSELDFEAERFQELEPGLGLRERFGFVPYEPDAPYQVGERQWAFRVRIDVLRPDPTAVRERLRELVKAEQEATGKPYVKGRVRRRLREQAEEELIERATPRSKVIECFLDDHTLYVGTTANAGLDTTLLLLRQLEVISELKAPWIDRNEPEIDSDIVDARAPGQSVLGCRFLKALLSDDEFMIDPEDGSVRLQTREARVSLSGAVLNDVVRYVENGAEILAAKLVCDAAVFRLDGRSFRISGLRIESEPHDVWIDQLGERMGIVADLFERLDSKFVAVRSKLG
jgi:hypothetical protein